jgi:hypothetical protein
MDVNVEAWIRGDMTILLKWAEPGYGKHSTAVGRTKSCHQILGVSFFMAWPTITRKDETFHALLADANDQLTP